MWQRMTCLSFLWWTVVKKIESLEKVGSTTDALGACFRRINEEKALQFIQQGLLESLLYPIECNTECK
jgi:hypothetical protein